MPPGQVIDIAYLKTLEKNTSVPIAYCPEVVTDPHARSIVDSAQASNFVPGYLASADGRHWEVFDVQKFSVNKFNWDEGEKSILDLFGTSIQHPEDHFVQYFCDTEHTPIERSSPRRSPRKNLPESDNSVGRQLFSVVSPGRGDADLPGQVGAQGDNERGKEGQGGEDDNVVGGDADLPGQVGAQGDNDQGKEGQGGVNDNVADQRKGSKDTDQGRFDRKNPPETIIEVGAQGDNERGKEGQGGVDDNVAGGDADLPGQVGAQGDNDQGKEGQGGVNDNVADQRKGSKDTDQGRFDRKNPPETIIEVGAQGDNERGKEGQGGVDDNVAGGDADLPGQVGAQGDNDQGKEGQGGVNDNVADQRKGSKDTDQGDVCPTVEKEKTASPRRSDRKKFSKRY